MRAVLALVLALLLPFASAGSEEDPEIVDPAGDAVPAASQWGDITAAWFEEADGNVTATLRLQALAAAPPMTAYLLVFDAGNASWYAAVVFIDETTPSFYTGEWDRDAEQPTGEAEATGTVEGTRLSVTFPASRVDAAPGTALTGLEAGVLDYKTLALAGAGATWLDQAQGQRDFPLAAAPGGGAAPAGDASTPGPALVMTLAGLAAAAALLRRR